MYPPFLKALECVLESHPPEDPIVQLGGIPMLTWAMIVRLEGYDWEEQPSDLNPSFVLLLDVLITDCP